MAVCGHNMCPRTTLDHRPPQTQIHFGPLLAGDAIVSVGMPNMIPAPPFDASPWPSIVAVKKYFAYENKYKTILCPSFFDNNNKLFKFV